MKRNVKLWCIIASSLILIGAVAFTVVMFYLKWDFKKLSTVEYQTEYYEINEDFTNININVKTANVVFVASENETCLITAFERVNDVKLTKVQDGTLVIEREVNRKWYQSIGIDFYTPTITVSIPAGEYENLTIKMSTGDVTLPKTFKFNNIDVSGSTGDVNCMASARELIKIKLSTGNIHVENVTSRSCEFSVSTGKITVKSLICENNVNISSSTGDIEIIGLSCKNLYSTANTSDISLRDVVASDKINIERSTGDVKFDCCDATDICVRTDTGDVIGTLISDKIFMTKTNTGKIDVPNTVNGGKCEITTSSGDIIIKIK